MANLPYSKWQHLLVFALSVILVLTFAQTTTSEPANFTRITAGPHVTDGGASYGVSWIDYDNDGWLDIYIGNAGVENNFLYHNEGDGTFTKITTSPLANDGSRSYSHAWGDYDNDGDEDVYVGRHNYSPNYFFTNNGDGTFTRVDTAGALTIDADCSNTHAWIDIDNDGDLDLYSQTETNNLPWSWPNALYRNDGGFFVKITTGEIVTDVNNAHGMAWSDYDNDGDLDLFVANAYFDYPLPDPADYMYRNCYYRNDGDFNFTKIVSGPVVTDLSISYAPSVGDYDNDGDQDLFVANGAMELANFLYSNNGDGSFTRITTAGEMVTNEVSTLGSSWVDYDNDGDLDLYVTTWDDYLSNELYENNGDGTFTRIMTGPLASDVVGNFGPAWGDYDRDGDLDVFITRYQNDNRLYRNDGNGNNWLNVKCVGTVSNASAIGAKVRIKATISGSPVWQLREISPAASYCMHHAINAHFGLGDASVVDSIFVEWPSGYTDTLLNVDANQYMEVMEGQTLDIDGDGLPGVVDNCPIDHNPGQEDTDFDGAGNACDDCTDTDGDSYGNPGHAANICPDDNCPDVANPGQADTNDDGIGNACCCGHFTAGQTGNANCSEDGKLTLSDITLLIDNVYISKTPLCCETSGNVNASTDGKITLSDITRLIDNVYISKEPTEPCP